MGKNQKIASELLVIERTKHVCHETPYFVKNFKHLFRTSHPLLLQKNALFKFSIDNEAEISSKLEEYRYTISNAHLDIGKQWAQSFAFEVKDKDDMFGHIGRQS